jgi:ABC-2 type transport system permease protein
MKQTLLILRYELITAVGRLSFLFAAIGLPLLSVLVFAGVAYLNESQGREDFSVEDIVAEMSGLPSKVVKAEGYVDESGLIKMVPSFVPTDSLRAFPSTAEAQQALEQGEITGYYVVEADYLETGKMVYVEEKIDPLGIASKGGLLERVLEVNLLGGDEHLAEQVWRPMNLEVTVLEPTSARDQNNPLTSMLPYGAMFIFYTNMMAAAGLLINSLGGEKVNRTIEILASSVSAQQLLAGKIAGLGLAGLIETSLWITCAYGLFGLSGQMILIPSEYSIPPTIIIWAVVFFVLGYLLFASLIASAGALAPGLREISQITSLILLPLLIPGLLFYLIGRDPNGTIATVLSLFPLTSPTGMTMRLAATNEVPAWQPFLAAGILALTIGLVIRMAAGLIRTQNLLIGQKVEVRRVWEAWVKKGKLGGSSGD